MLTLSVLLLLLQTPATQPAAQVITPPSAQDTLAYLNQAIDWYRHLSVEEGIAGDSADLRFVNDDRQIAKQVLQLSFEFARANAKLLASQKAPATTANDSDEPQRGRGMARAAATAEAQVKDAQAELETLKQKLRTAPEKQQAKLQTTIDEVQSELNLAQTRSETFRNILQFMGEGGEAVTKNSLPTQIDELQKSIPELEPEPKAGAAQSSPSPNAPNQTVQSTSRGSASGILDLITDLFALSRKMRTLDQTTDLTNDLAKSLQGIRQPLTRGLTAAAKRGEELAKAADTSDASQLQQQKRELDELTANFKQASTLVVPLGRQSFLFDLYKKNLARWRASIQSQYSVELRSLLLRVGALALALGVVFILAEIWRRATFRYVKDIRRRYQFLLLRRIVMWFAIGLTIAFGLATEIGSLATFAGLITAGIAVALQNVILAIAGYFFLVGKYGVRVGDRVQISGVTGKVIDIGMVRLHLMELGGSVLDPQPTGRVVVFSNSIVFQPTASFYKQIPGTNFVWHEVKLILAPDSDYTLAEKRLLSAVEKVFAKYQDKIVQQHRVMESAYSFGVEAPAPKSRLHLNQSGLEVVIRYPLELARSAEIDDEITRGLLEALEQPPKLKLVGSGTPNIQRVTDLAPAAG
jgi:small-conductance mechanosensitive channel